MKILQVITSLLAVTFIPAPATSLQASISHTKIWDVSGGDRLEKGALKVSAPDKRYFVKAYVGEGNIVMLDVFSNRKSQLAQYSDVTSFAWLGKKGNILLVATANQYDYGRVYLWERTSHVIFRNKEGAGADSYYIGAWLDSVNASSKNARIKIVYWDSEGNEDKHRTRDFTIKVSDPR